MVKFYFVLLAVCTWPLSFAVQAAPQQVALEITLPRMQVAEYHKPYLAVWLEDSARNATQVAVWYDVAMREAKGEEWLADLRQWWRRGGRSLTLPIDGITGATKGPGSHVIDLPLQSVLRELPDGEYRLRVEAAREVGGRELLSLMITLPLDNAILPFIKKGSSELSQVRLYSVAP